MARHIRAACCIRTCVLRVVRVPDRLSQPRVRTRPHGGFRCDTASSDCNTCAEHQREPGAPAEALDARRRFPLDAGDAGGRFATATAKANPVIPNGAEIAIDFIRDWRSVYGIPEEFLTVYQADRYGAWSFVHDGVERHGVQRNPPSLAQPYAPDRALPELGRQVKDLANRPGSKAGRGPAGEIASRSAVKQFVADGRSGARTGRNHYVGPNPIPLHAPSPKPKSESSRSTAKVFGWGGRALGIRRRWIPSTPLPPSESRT